jgi:hypothetical protein
MLKRRPICQMAVWREGDYFSNLAIPRQPSIRARHIALLPLSAPLRRSRARNEYITSDQACSRSPSTEEIFVARVRKIAKEESQGPLQMPFAKISARLVVDEENKSTAVEDVENTVDNLHKRGIPVFDSEVSSSTVCDVPDEQQTREELLPDKSKK